MSVKVKLTEKSEFFKAQKNYYGTPSIKYQVSNQTIRKNGGMKKKQGNSCRLVCLDSGQGIVNCTRWKQRCSSQNSHMTYTVPNGKRPVPIPKQISTSLERY